MGSNRWAPPARRSVPSYGSATCRNTALRTAEVRYTNNCHVSHAIRYNRNAIWTRQRDYTAVGLVLHTSYALAMMRQADIVSFRIERSLTRHAPHVYAYEHTVPCPKLVDSCFPQVSKRPPPEPYIKLGSDLKTMTTDGRRRGLRGRFG